MNFVSSVDSNTCLRDFIPSDKVHICEKGTGTFFLTEEVKLSALVYQTEVTKIIHGFVIRKYAKMTSSAELSETLAEGNGDNHYIANYVQVAPLGT